MQGGTQLQDYKTVGRQTFAYAYDLHLIHNSIVYVTVVAINRAGLRTVSYSDPIIIDKTPPVFLGIYDGDTLGGFSITHVHLNSNLFPCSSVRFPFILVSIL